MNESTPARIGDIAASINALRDEADRLDTILDKLVDMLTPICSNEKVEPPANKSPQMRQSTTPLAMSINEVTQRLAIFVDRLQYLMQRTQL